MKSFQSFNWCFQNACFLSPAFKDNPLITTETTSERPAHANICQNSVSKLVLCQSANWLSLLIDHLITQITVEWCTLYDSHMNLQQYYKNIWKLWKHSAQVQGDLVSISSQLCGDRTRCFKPNHDCLLSLSTGLCALTQPSSVVCWKWQHLFWELGCFTASFEQTRLSLSVHQRIVSSAPDTKHQQAQPVSRSGTHESVGLILALVIAPPHRNRACRLYFNMLASGCTLF